MDERQMRARINRIIGGTVHLVRLAAPENAHLAGIERKVVVAHPVMYGSRHHIVHLHLRMPVRPEHDGRVVVKSWSVVGMPSMLLAPGW